MPIPGMGILDDFNSNLNPFLEKMNKGELTLEDILNEDLIIQDIKSNNDSIFVNFLTNDKIKKLIDYSTKIPSIDEHNIGYKYPFNATEILCTENRKFQSNFMSEKLYNTEDSTNNKETIKKIKKGGFILELFKAIYNKNNEDDEFDDEGESEEWEEDEEGKTDEPGKKVEIGKKFLYENVDYLLNFLKESNETKENYVLVGYFYKILNNLINIHQMKIVKYLLDYPKKDEFDIIKLFIKHMNRKSMCNIVQKLLTFDDELISKFEEEKKIELLSQVFDELEKTIEKNKYECICECIYNVLNNRQFFDLFMTKKELLDKIYSILFNCKIDDKYNSIIKLLIKINENILQHFPVHYTEYLTDGNGNELGPLNTETCNSNDKSLSSPDDNVDILKKFLLNLFEILEKNKFESFDFAFNNDNVQNNEFIATYMEKQKKLGMKKLLQTEYLKTFIDILVNSSASKYNENKIEILVNEVKEKNIFWKLHNIFLDFPFNNIFQIYYIQIMKIIVNENSPNSIIDACFTGDKNNNIIEVYINKILSDMKFIFKLTNAEAFNPLFSYIVTILNKIFSSQNLSIKKIIENNKDISVFHEVIGQEIDNIFKQKLLLNDNNIGGLYIENVEETTPETFGPLNLLQIFQENCKIYKLYKDGGDYQKFLNEKKERNEKEKQKGKNENKIENKGLEYIDDFDEDEDPLFKVEKMNLKKEKENFLAFLNKPTEEVNNEEENKDLIIDNIDNDGDFKTGKIGRFKELWDDDDEDKEENKDENKEEKNDEKNKENSKNKRDINEKNEDKKE